MQLRIASWNVNGIRSVSSKGALRGFVDAYDPDVLCLQEVRANEKQALTAIGDEIRAKYPFVVMRESRVKSGYSGTAILSRVPVVADLSDMFHGIGVARDEGRICAVELADVVVVSVYTPNSKTKLERLEYRVGEWDIAFKKYMLRLKEEYGGKKSVVVAGDLNVAHEEIDIWNAAGNVKHAGFTPEERASFSGILRETGYVDAFRLKHKSDVRYTFWSNFGNARALGRGWRIDYHLVSSGKRGFVKDALICDEVKGSDHCPIVLDCMA